MGAPVTQAPITIAAVGWPGGSWRVERAEPIVGPPLPTAGGLDMLPAGTSVPDGCDWLLRGTTSHHRYTEREEAERLRARQAGLGRPEARCAALIPIRKSPGWWQLAQDERRAILEAQSRHIAIGLEYLPQVARRLYHCRDLGEPFDFLTWFEFAPEHAGLFDALVGRLRDSPEWRFVDREIDIRLTRPATA